MTLMTCWPLRHMWRMSLNDQLDLLAPCILIFWIRSFVAFNTQQGGRRQKLHLRNPWTKNGSFSPCHPRLKAVYKVVANIHPFACVFIFFCICNIILKKIFPDTPNHSTCYINLIFSFIFSYLYIKMHKNHTQTDSFHFYTRESSSLVKSHIHMQFFCSQVACTSFVRTWHWPC